MASYAASLAGATVIEPIFFAPPGIYQAFDTVLMAPWFLAVECHSITSILALKDVIHRVKGAHQGNGLLSTCW